MMTTHTTSNEPYTENTFELDDGTVIELFTLSDDDTTDAMPEALQEVMHQCKLDNLRALKKNVKAARNLALQKGISPLAALESVKDRFTNPHRYDRCHAYLTNEQRVS